MPTLLNANNYHYRRGGADVLYLEHARLFREIDWQVVDFAMEHPQNAPSDWSEHFVDEIEFGHDYSFADKLKMSGRVVYSRQAQRQIGSLIDATRPDVAHLHNVYHHLSPAILRTLRDRGVPTVLTAHDLKIACPAYQMLADDGICERCRGGRIHNVVRKRCIKGSLALSTVVFAETAVHRLLGTYTKCADKIVTSSAFYLEKFVEWGFDRDLFVHIPNHVSTERFHPANEPGGTVVFFGRLAPEKGVATLIRAAAVAGVAVQIVGTGPEAESLRSLADDVGASVEFLGYRTGEELHGLVRDARATVLPSEWYENAPVAVLESYALGTPVIGARIAGIPELVREGETGFMFDSGSVDELAAVLRRVETMTDAQLFEMGRAGRRWVETDFTTDLFVERMLDVYAELGVSV